MTEKLGIIDSYRQNGFIPPPEKVDEQLKSAEERKIVGNTLVKENSWRIALGNYHLAVSGIRSLVHLTTAQGKRADELLISCFGNMALCYSKLELWEKVINVTSQLLEMDPSNVKGIYRRGLAYLKKGVLDFAELDILSALELSPNDSAIRSSYALLQKKKNKVNS